jgi:hypothetical protein
LSEPSRIPSSPVRDRSPVARAAQHAARGERERRVVEGLKGGVAMAELARREGITVRGMRKYVRSLIARRAPEETGEFIAVQLNRLNEALLVSFDAMSAENLPAIDRVVKIVRELDRYRGLGGGAKGTETRRKLLESLVSGAETDASPVSEDDASDRWPTSISRRFSPTFLRPSEARGESERHGGAACPTDLVLRSPHRSHRAPRRPSFARATHGGIGTPRRGGLSHGPRPEEPAKRASRRTFQRALERPSRRDACGAAPQDEVGAGGSAPTLAVMGGTGMPRKPLKSLDSGAEIEPSALAEDESSNPLANRDLTALLGDRLALGRVAQGTGTRLNPLESLDSGARTAPTPLAGAWSVEAVEADADLMSEVAAFPGGLAQQGGELGARGTEWGNRGKFPGATSL